MFASLKVTMVQSVDLLFYEVIVCFFFFFQAEDGIRDVERSRGLGDVYKRQVSTQSTWGSMMRIDCSNVKGKQLFFYVDYFIASEFDGQFPELSENKELLKSIQRIYTHLLADELSNHKDMKGMAFHNFFSIVPKFFDNTLNNPDNAYKLALFATHDSTILAYLFAFGVTDKKIL
eukprot:TRINITY_DN7908_c0_g1_i5.p1 TRINITY_DN7908_c0_g1~~TRINITY_DN7908_c0_g1_i5.p1  ORF type:complete len:175 (-),score=46.72 TRINITY_DN7908_c0_g1_i5:414-938(-)